MRSPFITTVAAASATLLSLAAGCTSSVSFTNGGCDFGSDGCSEPCPTSTPASGSECTQNGQSCSYYGDCDETFASCNDGQWEVSHTDVICNPPPPPVCPVELPTQGSYCDPGLEGGYTCDGYLDPICQIPISAHCTINGSWEVDGLECNPPPPSFCNQLDIANCETTPECQWMVPGCGTPALPQEGCFSVYECSPGSCGFEESCVQVVIDPCGDSPCNACAELTSVCMANTDEGGGNP